MPKTGLPIGEYVAAITAPPPTPPKKPKSPMPMPEPPKDENATRDDTEATA